MYKEFAFEADPKKTPDFSFCCRGLLKLDISMNVKGALCAPSRLSNLSIGALAAGDLAATQFSGVWVLI